MSIVYESAYMAKKINTHSYRDHFESDEEFSIFMLFFMLHRFGITSVDLVNDKKTVMAFLLRISAYPPFSWLYIYI